MTTINHYLSLIKFSHTVFALPFAIIGYFLGLEENHQTFNLKLFLLVILCMVFARTAAMAFNRYIDLDIDSKNFRTANREIPSGIIKPKSALVLVILSSLLFIITTWFINLICFFLSPIALFVILGYSYTKRFTHFSHLVLGIGLSLAPIGAYLAVTGKFDLLPIILSFAVLFWVSGFDIIYAMQDEEFDKSEKLHSIPVFLGKKYALFCSGILHIICSLLIIWMGWNHHFGALFWMGSCIFISLLIYQHLLVKPHDLSRVNLAFGTTNGIASIVFAVFTLIDICLK
jgi:4-hydroxybenzoate polyprenyltransferase